MHLDRLIAVLEAVAVAGRAVSPSEIQQVTGIPRPTCYRLLQTLAEHRLLDALEDMSRYTIGERLKRLVVMSQSDVEVSQVAASLMAETANEFGEAVFLSRLRNKSVEIIRVKTPDNAARSFVHPGLGERPLHACSCSKVIAAFADQAFQDTIVLEPLRAYTGQTKTRADEIKRELATIRDRGYGECVEEVEVGVSSVAAPVHIRNIGVPFSVGVTGPVRRFSTQHRKQIGLALIGVAEQIAANVQLAQSNSRHS